MDVTPSPKISCEVLCNQRPRHAPTDFSSLKKVLAVLLLMVAASSLAIERIDWASATLAGKGWDMDELQVTLDFNAAGQLQFSAQVKQLELPNLKLRDIRLSCAALQLASSVVSCPKGALKFSSKQLKNISTPVSFIYHTDSKKLSLSVTSLALAGGQVAVEFEQADRKWKIHTHLKRVDLNQLKALLKQFDISLPALDIQGKITASVAVRGRSNKLTKISWELAVHKLAYANKAGTQAGEKLHLTSRGSAWPRGKDWQAKFQLTAESGMLFTDPLYFEYKPDQPQKLDIQLHWYAQQQVLDLTRIDIEHTNVVYGSAAARIGFADKTALQSLEITINQASLPDFNTSYLQPWLAGSAWDEVETSGALKGRLVWNAAQLKTLQLTFQDTVVKEASGLFGVHALNGNISWDLNGKPQASTLVWQAANIRNLSLGKARLQLLSRGKQAQMTQALSVDLLDGRLHVSEFDIDWSSAGGVNWKLDAVLSPISMQAFSTAVGWPELAGSLSGVIPKVEYKNSELSLGGTLLVQAFGGDITLRNLKVSEPLGLVPRLWADARLEHLDLEILTRTFSFGRIEGKLQGEIAGLYMEAWQPVAFDAHFETPPDDRSRRRISQKAVDSISNLGGAGVSGALSRGFLRFLEDFPYRRLGISCRLEKGVCQMDGVGAVNGGYYLVQGRILPPRLDMIGHEHRVDWHSLVQRLVAVTKQPAAMVR